jgi:hypothetical protein
MTSAIDLVNSRRNHPKAREHDALSRELSRVGSRSATALIFTSALRTGSRLGVVRLGGVLSIGRWRRRDTKGAVGGQLRAELAASPAWMYPFEFADGSKPPLLHGELPSVHDTRAAMMESVVREALGAGGAGTAIDIACSEGWFAHRLLDWGAEHVVGGCARGQYSSCEARSRPLRDRSGSAGIRGSVACACWNPSPGQNAQPRARGAWLRVSPNPERRSDPRSPQRVPIASKWHAAADRVLPPSRRGPEGRRRG